MKDPKQNTQEEPIFVFSEPMSDVIPPQEEEEEEYHGYCLQCDDLASIDCQYH